MTLWVVLIIVVTGDSIFFLNLNSIAITLFNFNYGYKSRYSLICIDSENNIIILCIIIDLSWFYYMYHPLLNHPLSVRCKLPCKNNIFIFWLSDQIKSNKIKDLLQIE